MKKYKVRLFQEVGISIGGIVESNPTAAFIFAQKKYQEDHSNILRASNAEFNIADAEAETVCALVDEIDETGLPIDGKSFWLNGDGSPMINGETSAERKIARLNQIAEFTKEFRECKDYRAYSTHAQNDAIQIIAIMATEAGCGYTFDLADVSADCIEVLKQLPSSKKWLAFTTYDHHTDTVVPSNQ